MRSQVVAQDRRDAGQKAPQSTSFGAMASNFKTKPINVSQSSQATALASPPSPRRLANSTRSNFHPSFRTAS